MVDYKKVGSKKITGKKTPVSVYKKSGSNKLYVKRSGKMVSYVTYKKSFTKKLLGNTLKKVKKTKVKKTKVKPRRRYTMGGDCSVSHNSNEGFMSEYFNENIENHEKMTDGLSNLGKVFTGLTGGNNNTRNNNGNNNRNNNRNNNGNNNSKYGGYYENEDNFLVDNLFNGDSLSGGAKHKKNSQKSQKSKKSNRYV
jgi:hypothetical protein